LIVWGTQKLPIFRDEYVVQDDEPTAALVDGEVFMLSARAQSYFGLGETGSKIWNLIRQPRKVSEICDELVQTCDVEPDACERETLNFLEELLEQNLIRVVTKDNPE
jgi:hypothetical protein